MGDRGVAGEEDLPGLGVAQEQQPSRGQDGVEVGRRLPTRVLVKVNQQVPAEDDVIRGATPERGYV